MDRRTQSSYNGRVNVMEPDVDTSQLFKMYDKMPVNDPTSFRNATQGIWCPTALSDAFFSGENMRIVQDGIKSGVFKKSNNQYRICDQNSDTLKIIMRSIFLQNAVNTGSNITQQIIILNNQVLDYAIPQVYGATISYNKYLRDASTLVQPIDRPIMSSFPKQLPRVQFGFSKEGEEE
jgi:hypothetical protein